MIALVCCPQIDWEPNVVLDIEEAKRILGDESRLEKVTAYREDQTRAYQSVFRDDLVDPATGKTEFLYFMHEEYQTAEVARSFR